MRAAEHGRSMEEEARAILRRVMSDVTSPRDLAAAIRAREATVATRKTIDYEGCGIQVIDPWTFGAHQ